MVATSAEVPVVREPGEGEQLLAGPTTTLVRVPGSATGGRLGVVELHLPPGFAGPPPHVHDVVTHCWYVLDGEVTLGVDGTDGTHGVGACLYVPAGTSHRFSTADGPGAVVLQVDSPRSLDGYFRDLVAAFPPGSPVDPDVVGSIMRRHDTRPIPAPA